MVALLSPVRILILLCALHFPALGAAQATSTTQAAGYAGSTSCRECHAKFYALWSTSFHGLAMQPFTPELGKARLTPQTNEVVAGPYRFRADLPSGVVIERTDKAEERYPIVQTMGRAKDRLRKIELLLEQQYVLTAGGELW